MTRKRELAIDYHERLRYRRVVKIGAGEGAWIGCQSRDDGNAEPT